MGVGGEIGVRITHFHGTVGSERVRETRHSQTTWMQVNRAVAASGPRERMGAAARERTTCVTHLPVTEDTHRFRILVVPAAVRRSQVDAAVGTAVPQKGVVNDAYRGVTHLTDSVSGVRVRGVVTDGMKVHGAAGASGPCERVPPSAEQVAGGMPDLLRARCRAGD